IGLGLARFAKPDLVGNDDAVTGLTQGTDCTLPRRTAEILAVHQDDGLAVRSRARHIHIGHEQLLTLRTEFVTLDRFRMIEVRKVWASGSTCPHPPGKANGERHS